MEPNSRQDAERKILQAMPNGQWGDGWHSGVLLADQICRAVDAFELINPFQRLEHGKLRPAGYELSVGAVYSKGGVTGTLSDTQNANVITVKPYEVVVIQTLERINLPAFMIARWNITVGNAYRGFLWVGAGQVDPGFKGFLCCPIYNLSDKEQTLRYGDSIAVIDFVLTTPPTDASGKFAVDFTQRKRIIFDDYGADALKSSMKVKLDKLETDEERTKSTVEDLRNTVFNSVGILIAAIGVVVTALALFVGEKTPSMISQLSPPLLISFAALALSFCALVFSMTKIKSRRILFASLSVLACLVCVYAYSVHGKQSTTIQNQSPPATPHFGPNSK